MKTAGKSVKRKKTRTEFLELENLLLIEWLTGKREGAGV